MADMQLVLKLIAEAQSAVAGLQAVTKEVRETGAATVKTSADAKGMGAAIVQAGGGAAAAVDRLNSTLSAAAPAAGGLEAVAADLRDSGAAALTTSAGVSDMGAAIVQSGGQSATAIEDMSGTILQAQRRIADLDAQMAGLRGIPSQVTAEIDRMTSALVASEARVTALSAEIDTLRALPPGLNADLQKLTAELGQAQARIVTLGAELAKLRALPPQVIPDTERFGRAAGEASRQAGYMAAQWNDMVMMALAGQNPMQLAIQQGSQMTQAYGPGGAGGALKMVGAGFMSMLSPMNLVTYAAIAVGAALVQALMEGGEQVKTLEDQITDLEGAVTTLRDRSGVSLDDLKKKYGDVTPEVIRLREEMTNLAGVQALQSAVDTMKALKAETEGSWWAAFTDKAFTDQNQIAQLLQVEPFLPGDVGMGATKDNPIIGEFQDAVKSAQEARGWDEQIAALDRLRTIFEEAAGGIKNMTGEQLAMVLQLHAQADQLRQAKALFEGVNSSAEKANDLARSKIATLETEGRIQAAIRDYGEDSLVVARLRLDAERQSVRAAIDATEASSELKDQWKAAWDAAHGIASEDIYGTVTLAVTAAADLETWLKKAWDDATGIGNSDLSAGILAAIGPAWELARALWDGHAASEAQRKKNEAAGAAVRRIPGGVDAVASDDLNWSGGNWSRVIPPKTPGGVGKGGGAAKTDELGTLSEQANRTMRDLDDALASVELKAKAGILSAADATDAVTSAKERAADALADLIPELERLGPAGQAEADKLKGMFGGLADQIKDVKTATSDLSKEMTEGFKAPFADFIAGTKSGADAWDDFTSGIQRSIAQKISNKFTDSLLTPVVDGLFSGFGDLFQFADGGVPGISDLSGQIRTEPTFFGMPGGGLGQLAEAGPEAIMPLTQGPGGLSVKAISEGRETLLALTRGADGKLGVQLPDWSDPATLAPKLFANGGVLGAASAALPLTGGGGSGGAMAASKIIINNTVSNQVATPVSERMEGNTRITEIMIEAVRDQMADDINSGRGPVPQALQQAFGLSRMGR